MSFWESDSVGEFRSQVTNSFTSYFRLWEFLRLRIEKGLGAKLHDIGSEEEFWRRILKLSSARQNRSPTLDAPIRHGDQVSLRGWYVSDWIPRMPGALWKDELMAAAHSRYDDEPVDFPRGRVPKDVRRWVDAFKTLHPKGLALAGSLPVYDWFGKTRICLSGTGSIRLPLGLGDDDSFACLGAITSGSWRVDAGIPIVVSRQVYREFDRARAVSDAAPECDLRGTIVIGELPPFFSDLPLALGEPSVPDAAGQLLRRYPGVPVAYLHVSSPMDCDFRANDSHPECNAWTLFKCGQPESQEDNLDAARMLAGLGAYGLTYHPFQPMDSESLSIAVRFLHDSPRWLNVTRDQQWNNWLRWGDTPADEAFAIMANLWSSVDVQLVTDFDGVVPRLTNAMFNLASPPVAQSAYYEFCRSYPGREST